MKKFIVIILASVAFPTSAFAAPSNDPIGDIVAASHHKSVQTVSMKTTTPAHITATPVNTTLTMSIAEAAKIARAARSVANLALLN